MAYERLTAKKLRDTDIYRVLDENGNVIVDRKLFERIIEQHNRLAELEDKIEQGTLKEEKTCKNISEMHPVDGFTCSECGISLEDYCEKEVDEESDDITYREYAIKYCPNCGAKVVEE